MDFIQYVDCAMYYIISFFYGLLNDDKGDIKRLNNFFTNGAPVHHYNNENAIFYLLFV